MKFKMKWWIRRKGKSSCGSAWIYSPLYRASSARKTFFPRHRWHRKKTLPSSIYSQFCADFWNFARLKNIFIKNYFFHPLFRNPPVLTAHNSSDIILRLPMGKRIRDIRWLSVWCRRFTVSYLKVSSLSRSDLERDPNSQRKQKWWIFSTLLYDHDEIINAYCRNYKIFRFSQWIFRSQFITFPNNEIEPPDEL